MICTEDLLPASASLLAPIRRSAQGWARSLRRLVTVSDCDRRIHVLSAIAEAGSGESTAAQPPHDQLDHGVVVTEITSSDVDDIYAARAAIETAGADALTATRDPAIYRELASLVDHIERAFARGDVAGVLEGDRLFHAALAAAAGSPRLSRFHTQLEQEQRLALSLAEHSRRQLGRTADDHRVLLQALHGTRAQARAQLASHLQAGAAELHRLRGLLTVGKEKEAVTPS